VRKRPKSTTLHDTVLSSRVPVRGVFLEVSTAQVLGYLTVILASHFNPIQHVRRPSAGQSRTLVRKRSIADLSPQLVGTTPHSIPGGRRQLAKIRVGCPVDRSIYGPEKLVLIDKDDAVSEEALNCTKDGFGNRCVSCDVNFFRMEICLSARSFPQNIVAEVLRTDERSRCCGTLWSRPPIRSLSLCCSKF